VVDTYSSVAFAKLYTVKIPVTAEDTLNDRVLPFFDEHDVPVLRVLTDRAPSFVAAWTYFYRTITQNKANGYNLLLRLNNWFFHV
jgi:hypothetical protein